MAKEYIEREAVLEKQIGVVVYDEGGWDANVRAVPVEDIEAAPAADVVEVVRCAQCKHFNVITEDGRIKIGCSKHEIVTFKNDFCSYGERRDNNAAD